MSKSHLYRADVERRDRQFIWMLRSGVALAAALLVWFAVWSSGLDHSLLDWMKARAISNRYAALSQPKARPVPPPPILLGKTRANAFGGLQSSVSKVPERLVLTGTVLGSDPHAGFAFIGIEARHPQTYAAGALLANGARLTAIFRRYVVLEKGDRQARLYLGGGGTRQKHGSDDPLLTVGGHEVYTPAVANAKEDFTDFIRETPLYDGETVRGFQVYPGKQVSVFTKMGLQPGDVITSIDGVPLNDPTEAVAMFRQLAAGTSESAQVVRGGKSASVTLDGSLIASELEREQEAATGSVSGGGPSR